MPGTDSRGGSLTWMKDYWIWEFGRCCYSVLELLLPSVILQNTPSCPSELRAHNNCTLEVHVYEILRLQTSSCILWDSSGDLSETRLIYRNGGSGWLCLFRAWPMAAKLCRKFCFKICCSAVSYLFQYWQQFGAYVIFCFPKCAIKELKTEMISPYVHIFGWFSLVRYSLGNVF